MNEYREGAMLFCDFAFCGKPRARCIEVVEEGDGRSATDGRIRVRLLEDCKGYRKDEVIVINACTAVPIKQEITLSEGQFIRRVNTLYRWVKTITNGSPKQTKSRKSKLVCPPVVLPAGA
jgi:hypothetical protein